MKPANFEFARAGKPRPRLRAILRAGERRRQSRCRRPIARPDAEPAPGAAEHPGRHHCHSRIDAHRGRRGWGDHRRLRHHFGHRGWPGVAWRSCRCSQTVAGGVAYRAVRNRGTIGGSICHADPAGDWLPALCALGAECIVADGRQTRRMPIDRIRDRRVRGGARAGRAAASHSHPASVALRPLRLLQGVPQGGRIRAGERCSVDRSRARPLQSRHRRDPRAADRHRRRAHDFRRNPASRAAAIRLDEQAAAELLRRAGHDRPATLRLHLTALARAAAQAMAQ